MRRTEICVGVSELSFNGNNSLFTVGRFKAYIGTGAAPSFTNNRLRRLLGPIVGGPSKAKSTAIFIADGNVAARCTLELRIQRETYEPMVAIERPAPKVRSRSDDEWWTQFQKSPPT